MAAPTTELKPFCGIGICCAPEGSPREEFEPIHPTPRVQKNLLELNAVYQNDHLKEAVDHIGLKEAPTTVLVIGESKTPEDFGNICIISLDAQEGRGNLWIGTLPVAQEHLVKHTIWFQIQHMEGPTNHLGLPEAEKTVPVAMLESDNTLEEAHEDFGLHEDSHCFTADAKNLVYKVNNSCRDMRILSDEIGVLSGLFAEATQTRTIT
ncbi:hypothetical protein C8F01DRAFT_1231532 [Mycena amicta]|nr:hypothetical protein C8F01DRAFT_1231532 [Mycena amicta]